MQIPPEVIEELKKQLASRTQTQETPEIKQESEQGIKNEEVESDTFSLV